MLVQCEYPSRALGYPTPIDVFLPDDNEDRKYPVLYLLHGGDGAPWIRHTNVMRYAQEAGVAVVMPYCRNTCWRIADESFRNMPLEPDKVVDFERYMLSELPQLLARNFPISTARKDTYIAGLSLGGYGAAYYSMTHPELYGAVGIFSGYIFGPGMFAADRKSMTDEQLQELMMPELIQAVKDNGAQGRQFPKVFMMLGTKEVLEPPRVFRDLLIANGAEVTYDCTTYPYAHEWETWENCIHDFLKWIPQQSL